MSCTRDQQAKIADPQTLGKPYFYIPNLWFYIRIFNRKMVYIYLPLYIKYASILFPSKYQQYKMACYCTEIFGDLLLASPLDSHPVTLCLNKNYI